MADQYEILIENVVHQEEVRSSETESRHVPKHGNLMSCEACGVNLKGRNEFVKHQREYHGTNKIGTIKCKEPSCDFACFKIENLNTHLTENHSIVIERLCETLKDEEAFQAWKDEYEKSTNSQYRLACSKKKGAIRYFNCSRTGFYEPKKNSKRKSKLKGTSKMNGHCTSRICVKRMDSGELSVDFVTTHHGHDVEPHHLRLSHEKRALIFSLFKSGLDYSDIVVKINNIERGSGMALTTRKDVLNVAYTYLNDCLDHQYSYNSPKSSWENEKEGFNIKDSIIFHKASGDIDPSLMPPLEEEDFVLVIMSPLQQMSLQTHAMNGLCCEASIGLTKSKVYQTLITIFTYVSTQNKKGENILTELPLAFCISNKNSYAIKVWFFNAIKEKCGNIHTPFLCSNEWTELYKAWCSVFTGDMIDKVSVGIQRPLEVASPWEVRQTFENAIDELIVQKANKDIIKAKFHKLISLGNDFDFHSSLSEMNHLLSSTTTMHNFCSTFFWKFLNDSKDLCWAGQQYQDYAEEVSYLDEVLTEHLRKNKLTSICNKNVGRCVSYLMRYYNSRISLFDCNHSKKRKRERKAMRPRESASTSTREGSKIIGRILLQDIKKVVSKGALLKETVKPVDIFDRVNKVFDILDCNKLKDKDLLEQERKRAKKPALSKAVHFSSSILPKVALLNNKPEHSIFTPSSGNRIHVKIEDGCAIEIYKGAGPLENVLSRSDLVVEHKEISSDEDKQLQMVVSEIIAGNIKGDGSHHSYEEGNLEDSDGCLILHPNHMLEDDESLIYSQQTTQHMNEFKSVYNEEISSGIASNVFDNQLQLEIYRDTDSSDEADGNDGFSFTTLYM